MQGLPAGVARGAWSVYAAIATIGAGSGATALGCWIYARAADQVSERGRTSTAAGLAGERYPHDWSAG